MRIITSLLLLTFYCYSYSQPGNSKQLAMEGVKVIELEKGTLSYTITEGGEGSVTFSFDQYGLRSATLLDIQYTMYGIETAMKESDIRDGEFRYIYDLLKQTGRQKKVTTEIDLLRYKSLNEARESIYSVNGGSMIGQEKVLDKSTEHWTFTSGPIKEAWYWNGIPLKAVIKRPRVSYTMEVNQIDLTTASIVYPEIEITEN